MVCDEERTGVFYNVLVVFTKCTRSVNPVEIQVNFFLVVLLSLAASML